MKNKSNTGQSCGLVTLRKIFNGQQEKVNIYARSNTWKIRVLETSPGLAAKLCEKTSVSPTPVSSSRCHLRGVRLLWDTSLCRCGLVPDASSPELLQSTKLLYAEAPKARCLTATHSTSQLSNVRSSFAGHVAAPPMQQPQVQEICGHH